jgi:hypothetical protein
MNSFPKSETDLLHQACDESTYAINIDSFDARRHSGELTCMLLAVPRAFFWVPASFIVVKNSPYRRLFSH